MVLRTDDVNWDLLLLHISSLCASPHKETSETPKLHGDGKIGETTRILQYRHRREQLSQEKYAIKLGTQDECGPQKAKVSAPPTSKSERETGKRNFL